MGRSKGNLGRRVPARVNNPPSKTKNPEWWKDGENLMSLNPSNLDRRKYEKKQKESK